MCDSKKASGPATVKGDEYYPVATKGFTDKALYKIANLMKHGYEMKPPVKGARVAKNNDSPINTDDLIILSTGEVFKKVIY